MDYDEFLEGMSSFKRSGDKALRFCFDIYDKDGVGCINLEQLKSVLSCVTRRQSLDDVSEDETNSSEGKNKGVWCIVSLDRIQACLGARSSKHFSVTIPVWSTPA